ncbi:MAG: hypothetical protein H7Z43_16025 [Clostridia bacterium]|nr:hypothetical protein [Deltaproteobacteria bacterium]
MITLGEHSERLRFVLFCVSALAFSGDAHAQDSSLSAARGQLDQIENSLTSLANDVRNPVVVDEQARFARRLNDAEILFLLGDSMRASLVLYDAVDIPSAKAYAQYDEAIFFLAESLFAMRHDLAARDRFEDIVRRNDQQYFNLALQRLIQIADRTGRFENIEQRINTLKAAGRLPSEIGYIWAKSLVLRNRAEEAKATAVGVPQESKLWGKAQYLIAVAEVQLGRYGEARIIFESLQTLNDKYEEAGAVRDLASIDRGRIFLDQGDVSNAVDSYQHVARDSPQFDQSLYEATWGYVRAAAAKDGEDRSIEYRKAERTLEILLLSNAENELVPEARLLYGNILLRLAQFDDATLAFSQVVDRYKPARGDLQEMLATEDDPRTYYDEVVARARMGDTELPPVAVVWAQNEKPLQNAVRVSKDLDQSDKWIDESKQLVDELLRVLDSNRRATFFPQLRDEQARAFEIENTLTAVNQNLLRAQRDLVHDDLDADSRKELDAIERELASIDAEYRALPQRRDELESRITEREEAIDDQGKRVFRAGFDLESMRTQVRALNAWYGKHGRDLPTIDRESLRERIDQQTAEIDALEKEQKSLASEVTVERKRVALTAREAREITVRDRYEELLAKERDIFEKGTPNINASGRATFEQIQQQRDRMSRFTAELGLTFAAVAREMDQRSGDLKSKVLKERLTLDELRDVTKLTRVDAEGAVGDVAHQTVAKVAAKFEDLVLRADVGVVDVAWQLKEQQTAEINRRVTEQRRELEVLDAEFREVLAE